MEEKNLGYLGFQIIWLTRRVTTEIQNKAGTGYQKPKMTSQEHGGKKDYKMVAKAKVCSEVTMGKHRHRRKYKDCEQAARNRSKSGKLQQE